MYIMYVCMYVGMYVGMCMRNMCRYIQHAYACKLMNIITGTSTIVLYLHQGVSSPIRSRGDMQL